MWLPIIKDMVAYLQTQPEFIDVLVQGGTNGKRPEKYPVIFICRNGEGNIDFQTRCNGLVSLWVELWIKNNDPDPIAAYEALYELEQMFLIALPAWVKQLQASLGVAAKVTIPHFVGDGDGDQIRPKCGSQATINIIWKR